MHRQSCTVDVANVLAQVAKELGKLVRHGVADRIRDVDGGGTGVDHGFDHLREELELGARSVLRRELDVLAKVTRHLHALDGAADDLVLGHVQLVLTVDGAGGEKDMDSPPGGRGDGAGHFLDVIARSSGKPTDDRSLDLAGDGIHRLPVARRGRWKSGLDDIHAEFR